MQRKLITSTLCSLAAAMLLVAGSSTASAAPIAFFDGQGSNGHFYEIRGNSNSFSDGPGTAPWSGAATNMTWAQGQSAANAAGGISGFQSSLVTITSQEELNFLMSASGPVNHGIIGAAITFTGAFIGLSDQGGDNFGWEPVTLGTGTPQVETFDFTNWDSGEPDEGSSNIVKMMATGFWRDQVDGNISNGFIIEWSPIPEPGSMVLCGLGALAMAGYGWRRRRRNRK